MSTWRAVWEWKGYASGGMSSAEVEADSEDDAVAGLAKRIADAGYRAHGPVYMVGWMARDIGADVDTEMARRAAAFEAERVAAVEAEERAQLRRLFAKWGAPT